MTKKHFIELADVIRKPGMMPAAIGRAVESATRDTDPVVESLTDAIERAVLKAVAEELADFCKTQNSQFDRQRWLGYIAGTNGPSGGKL